MILTSCLDSSTEPGTRPRGVAGWLDPVEEFAEDGAVGAERRASLLGQCYGGARGCPVAGLVAGEVAGFLEFDTSAPPPRSPPAGSDTRPAQTTQTPR